MQQQLESRDREFAEARRQLSESQGQTTEALKQQAATSAVLRVISTSPKDAQPVFDAILQSATVFCTAETGILFRFAEGAFYALATRVPGADIFEVLLNATSMFNHSNVRIAQGADRVLRWFVVTPDMHRVHHSIVTHETNSNFGFNLPWWDRIFGTYRSQPAAGHEGMTIGIQQFRDPRELGLLPMLLQPFRGGAGIYPLGQRQSEQ